MPTQNVKQAELSYVSLLSILSEIIASGQDIQTTLDSSVKLIQNILHIERCSILLHDTTANELRVGAASGISDSLRREIRVRPGEGVAGAVFASGEARMISDLGNTPVPDETRGESRYSTNSYISVPLLAGGKRLGVVSITNKRNRAPLNQEDLDVLKAAARLLGVALEHAQLNARIGELNRELVLTIEHLPVGIIVLRQSGEIVTCNQRLADMLSLGAKPRGVAAASIPGHGRTLQAIAAAALQNRTEEDMILEADPAGGHPLRVTACPINRPDGAPEQALVIVEDLALSREVAELRRLEEMKSNFISLVSHELRTPLTSARGAASLLTTYYSKNLDETQTSLLRIIGNNVERLIETINTILDISLIDDHRLELTRIPCDVTSILHQVLKDLDPALLAKNLSVKWEFGERSCNVPGDAVRLAQAFRAVLDNAIKHSPKDSSIQISGERRASSVHISISDSGEGIPEGHREQVFEKFYQVEDTMTRRRGGAGLGLYLAREIVILHGGTLSVHVADEGGALLKFTLPAA